MHGSPPPSDRPTPDTEAEGLRVLLVEDNPGERWLFTEILRSRGHTVTACEDGESGWEVYQADPYPLILLDWLLPEMDGLDLARKIRASPGGDRCVIVVVTGRNRPEDLEEVLDAGADDYIGKPVDVALLNIRLAVAEREVQAVEERTRTEEALEATTRELKALFENLDDVFFSLDPEAGRLLHVSPGVEKVFGVSPDALQEGRSWEGVLYPEDLELLQGALERLPPDRSHTIQYAVPGQEERWVEATYKPDRKDGRLVRVDGVIVDVTERRKAQQEISARHQELLTLYRISEVTLSAPSLEAGYDEILEELSHATGYPIIAIEHYSESDDCMVIAAARGIPMPEDGTELRVPASETISGTVVRTGQAQVEPDVRGRREHSADVLLDLKVRTYLAFPMFVSGTVVGTLTFAHTEVTEPGQRLIRWAGSLANYIASFLDRMRAEAALRESEQEYRALAEQLQQANKELESFAYSVSHDLRAPLRTMQGFAHALLEDYGDDLPPEASDYARRIIQSGQHSERLISDLLNYSRLSFEEVQLKPVDLGAVVTGAMEQVEADLKEAGARVEVAEELPTVLGNQVTLTQVVTNLLSNAVKFVADGTRPEVRIRAEEKEDSVRLWVEDNGVGIAKEQQERVFRTFERLSESSSRPGTGIGLAIVRRGMERIGGTAGVESEPGKGARFWVETPRRKESAWWPGQRRKSD